MTKDRPSNVAASVRQRLLNIIRETGEDPNLVWTRYATERFLYRLSISEYARDFILKGAMLFMVWTGQLYRPTVGMDFLGKARIPIQVDVGFGDAVTSFLCYRPRPVGRSPPS